MFRRTPSATQKAVFAELTVKSISFVQPAKARSPTVVRQEGKFTDCSEVQSEKAWLPKDIAEGNLISVSDLQPRKADCPIVEILSKFADTSEIH